MMNAISASLPETLIFMLRIMLACICGGAIGFERTRRLKEAGIRTHCIIAAASALLMIISKYGFFDMGVEGAFYAGTDGADASRIASQIVSGISFLGAGVIFRNGNSVKGLTTAAGIWATAAVGMAFGSGMYLLGLMETAIIVLIQIIFHRFSIGNDAYSESEVRITANDSADFRETLLSLIENKRIQVLNLKIERSGENVVYSFALRTKQHFPASEALRIFAENPHVRSISM